MYVVWPVWSQVYNNEAWEQVKRYELVVTSLSAGSRILPDRKLQCGQQENIFPFAFINAVSEISIKRHRAKLVILAPKKPGPWVVRKPITTFKNIGINHKKTLFKPLDYQNNISLVVNN